MKVRLDISAGGGVSIRQLHEHRLDNSLTIMEVEERCARRVVTRCCNLTYSDDALASLGITLMGRSRWGAPQFLGI